MIDPVIVEQIKESWRDLWPASADKKGIICPLPGCSHGAHGDGVTEIKGKPGLLHCFGCDFTGDALQLLAVESGLCTAGSPLTGSNFLEAVKIGASRLGLFIDTDDQCGSECIKHHGTQERAAKKGQNKAFARNQQEEKDPSSASQDYSGFLKMAQAALTEDTPAAEYLTSRGISLETAKMAGIGWVPAWRHPKVPDTVPMSPRLIIPAQPFGSGYYTRDVRPNSALNDSARKYVKQTCGEANLIHASALQSSPCFITEGWADALSIIEAGGNALALGSTSNKNKLLEALDDMRTRGDRIPKMADALDEDDAGRKCAEYLGRELAKRGVSFLRADLLPNGCKDANEALIKDSVAFKKAVDAASKAAQVEPAPLPDTAPDEFGLPKIPTIEVCPQSKYLQTKWMQDIEVFRKAASRKTGYSNWDELQPFAPGLYIIGAIPSLGKTAFCLQLADQLTAAGEHVIYFSLEQTAEELAARSLSRMAWQLAMERGIDPKLAPSALQIRAGNFQEPVLSQGLYEEARERYCAQSETLFIAKSNFQTTWMEVEQTVRHHIDTTGVVPTVFVDYIQLLHGDLRQTEKQILDEATRALRSLYLTYGATVVAVSSVNRANYTVPTGFEAFKESGGIEFTADVLAGLDLACVHHAKLARIKAVTTARHVVDLAKSEDPRQIGMHLLKNRFGRASSYLWFDYHPSHDVFVSTQKPKQLAGYCEEDTNKSMAPGSWYSYLQMSEAERDVAPDIWEEDVIEELPQLSSSDMNAIFGGL